MNCRVARIALWAVLLLVGSQVRATQVIEAWSYYPAPPFLIDEVSGAGLSADLVAYLNKALAGKYEVRLVLLPRARLNLRLGKSNQAFVIFAPSAIFGGPDGGDYLWTVPLFADRQEMVSRRDRPFEFKGPSSLAGVKFAAMLGHTYPMIAKEIETGEIQVDRVNSETSLVSMLLARHVDVVTLPNSVVRYFMRGNPAFREAVVLSSNSLGDFSRHLMFRKGMERERDDFDRVVRKMNVDPTWLQMLAKYGLQSTTGMVGDAPKLHR